MRLALALTLALLGACARGAEQDLPAIVAIRSAAAEWALVNRESERGRLTPAYSNGMRAAAREQIASEARALRHTPAAARTADALLALPGDAAPERIEHYVAALRSQEEAI